MLFKKKGKQPQKDDISPPTHTPMDDKTPTSAAAAGAEDMATDKSKAKANELKDIRTNIIYPSGLKLAMLMLSIFVGMFLISLVRSRSASVSPLSLRWQALVGARAVS
jgi:hypothetical protein